MIDLILHQQTLNLILNRDGVELENVATFLKSGIKDVPGWIKEQLTWVQ